MKRKIISPRPDWQAALREYHYGPRATPAAAHWDESACYIFSAAEVDRIEAAADELHAMVVDAVRHVIENRLFGLLGIRPEVARLIEESWSPFWEDKHPNPHGANLVSRLDLAYDGRDTVKLLGCHYDGPQGLFETAVVQWNWLENRFPDADQFNGLHEALVDRFRQMCVGLHRRDRLHLACATPDPAREGEIAYLAAVAEEAGIEPCVLALQDVGWDGADFRDMEERVISWLLKIYPWEMLIEDDYGRHLKASGLSVLEPAWTMVASNHGLLPVLWELYPEHPNLVPAFFQEADLAGAPQVTRRALFGLDRAAQRLAAGNRVLFEAAGAAIQSGHVFLAQPALFRQDGQNAMLQAWLVGDKCLGMAVRESDEALVGPDAALIPHLFNES